MSPDEARAVLVEDAKQKFIANIPPEGLRATVSYWDPVQIEHRDVAIIFYTGGLWEFVK